MKIKRSTIVTASLVLSIGLCSIVMCQPHFGTSGTITPPPKKKTNAPTKVVTRTRIERVTPTTGSLSVAAEANASLLVEPLTVRNGTGQSGVVPPDERIFIFVDLKPGRYRVAGTLAEHKPVEAEVVIAANKSQKVTLNFELILYSVTIKTNVNAGELKYGPEDKPLTRVDTIQNQTVQLKLPAGKYVVEIAPREFGYETRRETISVDHDQTLDLALKRTVMSRETLSPTWTSAELQGWEMPQGWQADSRRNLWVKGRGVALPRAARNRYYQNFRLESNVKMTNGVAVSFALRARDAQNYYLLQLTGGNSDEQYTVRLFAVKNGVQQRLGAVPISRSSAGAMAAGQFFNVSIKMTDYDITVDIVDSQTGAPYTLGVLSDADHTFAVGAVGIAARDNEEFVIERFVICPSEECLKN
jgi:hypothetical protein